MTAPPGGARVPVALVGDGLMVPCVTAETRPYLNLDAAASTTALPAVAERVQDFLPWYSSVHRGAGYKSRLATAAYEDGPGGRSGLRRAADRRRRHRHHLPQHDRGHQPPRLPAAPGPDDVVVTTVVEHHANLLPWARSVPAAFRRVRTATAPSTSTRSSPRSTSQPRPRLLAVTGASNVTGWLPPLDAHHRRRPRPRHSRPASTPPSWPPHRPLPAGADYLAWSGHKMYAPFGGGILVGPRATFADGDPFLAGGGAVDLVDLDEVAWTDPPEREEAGSPNVLGAVALHAAIDALHSIGWTAVADHDRRTSPRLRAGLAGIAGVRLLGPDPDPHPPARRVHRRGGAPRPGRGPPERRARDRGPPRLLLRPPLPHAPPRPVTGGDRRLPRPTSAPATAPHPGRGAGQRRHQHHRGRHRPAARRGGRHRQRTARRSSTPRTRPRATTGPTPTARMVRTRFEPRCPVLAAHHPSRCDSRLSELREGTPPMTLHFTRPQGPRSFW